MREIKFRAWRKDKKEWHHLMELPENWHGDNLALVCQYPELFEICEWTGLKDKNGKEIYEGDILDFGGLKPIEILWEESRFRTKMFGSEPIKLTTEGCKAFTEVIGNIFENPELLSKEEGK